MSVGVQGISNISLWQSERVGNRSKTVMKPNLETSFLTFFVNVLLLKAVQNRVHIRDC